MLVWRKRITAFRDYVGKIVTAGVIVTASPYISVTLLTLLFDHLLCICCKIILLSTEFASRWWISPASLCDWTPRNTSTFLWNLHLEVAVRDVWRGRTWGRLQVEEVLLMRTKIKHTNIVMRCVNKVCYVWLALLFLKVVCCSFLLHVLDISAGHLQVSNQITWWNWNCSVKYVMLRNKCHSICSILYMYVFGIKTVCSPFTLHELLCCVKYWFLCWTLQN